MAQKKIHPDYHEITVVLTDGSEFKTKSACKDKVIKLDIDPLNHPAWKAEGGTLLNLKNSQVSKFNKKFGGFDFGFSSDKKEGEKKPEDKKENKKEDKKEEKK